MILCRDMKADEMRDRLVRAAHKFIGPDVQPDAIGTVGRAFKAATAKPDNGGWDIEGVATTDDVDCENEVVLPGGLDWGPLNAYKTLYGDHIYGVRTAVATLRWVARSSSPNGFRIRARMLPDEFSEDIPRYRILAERGALGYSIGFFATDRGTLTPDEAKRYPRAKSIVRKAAVFECSLTSCPCNLACAGASVYADDSKASVLADLVAKSLLPGRFGSLWDVAPPPRRVVVLT